MEDLSKEELEAFNKEFQALCDKYGAVCTIVQNPQLVVKKKETK